MLCHIKCDQLVNFYIHLKNCDIFATVRLISTKFGMIRQNVSQVCRPLKHLILKIQDSRQAICLTPFLHHHAILQFVDFQDDSCLPSLNFEIEIFNSQSLQRYILHYLIKFCGHRSNCCTDITFLHFSSEM